MSDVVYDPAGGLPVASMKREKWNFAVLVPTDFREEGTHAWSKLYEFPRFSVKKCMLSGEYARRLSCFDRKPWRHRGASRWRRWRQVENIHNGLSIAWG